MQNPVCLSVHVVVQFFSWFKVCFPMSQAYYHTLPYPKTKAIPSVFRYVYCQMRFLLLGRSVGKEKRSLKKKKKIEEVSLSSAEASYLFFFVRWETGRGEK